MELHALRPIINDKAFTLNEKMEILEACFDRMLLKELKQKKQAAIQKINSCKNFDKTDTIIIIKSL